MKLQFYLRFHTEYGQSLWISGDTDELGNNDPAKALAMNYLNEEFWYCSVEIKRKELQNNISYKYILKNTDGGLLHEWGHDLPSGQAGRQIDVFRKDLQEVQLTDTWNHAGEYENVFYLDAFNKVLLKANHSKNKAKSDKNFTHVFKVKAPLLKKNEIICLAGNAERLSNWLETKPVLLGKDGDLPTGQAGWWKVKLDLSDCSFPVAYKYGVYNSKEKKFVGYEEGNNRLLCSDASKKKLSILHDGFVHLPNNTWKGAGVAIPVFSLRSENSFGVGEFADIKLLVDWAKATGLKLIQLLPVNDTMANFNWTDSYPYSAISAFALHPLYINLAKVAGEEFADQLVPLKTKQEELNELAVMDYEEVMRYKFSVLKELYEVMGKDCFESDDYKVFFKQNRHWLESFAAFCYLRDKYNTPNFEEWKSNSIYNKVEIDKLVSPGSPAYKEIGFYYFTQYHLHVQLKEAADYAHKKGIVLKGDIPIGISRNSCDVWVYPEMFNKYLQAGAPPDDFTAAGQNWGFPIYNWEKMQENDFTWWKQRFEQMNNYFDAFRIDHILGFFRIWSIPADAVQGIMGKFVSCLPVHINEFGEKGIWFDYQRYCRPFITDEVLEEIFEELADIVKEKFLVPNEFGGYDLELKYETQQQVEEHFATLNETGLPGEAEENACQEERLEKIKLGLFDLISNVILFDQEGSEGTEFHFRISIEKTSSFLHLIPHVQERLKELYIDYFYHRQDGFWYKEAMHRLPPLKAATNMLVCGEDLGMVPHCVPDVMQQLGILSLEIQRMPKDPKKEFFHPNDAPYLSVITPSTHDMSTIRGWWEENRERTQIFYHNIMGQWGDAPQNCEAWINRAIVLQHLYSPAMWSIFQLQDILGMNEILRREDPLDERINNPADPKHYWQYRMHISLEELIDQKEFNEELKGYVEHSGRSK
ncbi:MAG TPA: 4-alpha-glucanotransferase [Chitinophagaceae bacterium]|nr:4-alpha-glucanotransferase [Chitinophagaceae bacterium]